MTKKFQLYTDCPSNHMVAKRYLIFPAPTKSKSNKFVLENFTTKFYDLNSNRFIFLPGVFNDKMEWTDAVGSLPPIITVDKCKQCKFGLKAVLGKCDIKNIFEAI